MFKRIARPIAIACLAALLAGCPRIYLSFEKHGGSFLAAPKGPQFVHIEDHEWDSNENALLYFYRPLTDWSAEEIDAPTVYIDDERYVNLQGGGWTWLEVAPGKRRLTMRRPLGVVLGFEGINDFALSKIIDTEFDVEAGGIYYFRYSEVDPPKEINPALEPDDPLAQGDMQLVSWEIAFPEIVDMKLMTNRPPFAKSDAARSIVHEIRMGEFEREEKELLLARQEEIAQLKEDGHYRPNKWWCLYLCGGSPTKRIKADSELRKLEKRKSEYEYQLALNENNEDGPPKKWWWPF